MNKNHVIVGLGGTGGKVICALRKLIFQEFRKLEPDVVHLEYLYVDSDASLMHPDHASWRVLGKSVQLGSNNQLVITGTDLRTIIDDVNAYPGVRDWIGSGAEWASILNSIVGETLGQQKRRLGRFLFANKAVQFTERVRSLARSLQDRGEVSVTFHVCCGLAGGTGSGSIVDVLAQIRDAFPDPRAFRIIAYCLLPDRNPPPEWDTGNYHANGYAALLELNALSTGAYRPYDVTGRKGRMQLKDPFNGCYVFSNENERGRAVDVKRDIPNIVADFLYQKIITVRTVQWENLGRMENAENGDGSPETSPGAAAGERGKRFLTFGIKRLAIPEQEIRELLTYSFARQAALQLQFNHWIDGQAFTDEPRPQDFREQVAQKDLQHRWLISDDHLRLSVGILDSERNNPRWKPFAQAWQDVTPHFKEFVRETFKSNVRVWNDELKKLFEKRHAQEFRELGVQKFFETKEGDRKDHLREIRMRIERDLIEDWRNGVSSMFDIRRLLEALTAALEDRLQLADAKIVQAIQNEEEARGKVRANDAEWADIGLLSGWMGKRIRVFDAQALCLQEQYIYRTAVAAWKFAKGLLQALINELTALQEAVGACTALITDATKQFNEAIATRCVDGGQSDIQQQLVKYYDPEAVKGFTRKLLIDREAQLKQTKAVRDALIGKLGPSPSFAVFRQKITRDGFVVALEDQCEINARQAHDIVMAETKDRGRLFGDSIVVKLQRDFGGNLEGLQRYVRDLVLLAGNYVTFRTEEINRRGDGIPDNSGPPVSSFTVFLPEAPVDPEFDATLRDAFRKHNALTTEFIPARKGEGFKLKPSEVTLVSVANLFPLRYLEHTTWLRDKYEARIQGADAVRARLELHGEGDGRQCPSLFAPSGTEVKEAGLPYVLLGRAIGMISPTENPTTGLRGYSLLTKDQDGFDNDPVFLGTTLAESFERLDAAAVRAIRGGVEQRLRGEYVHADRKAELKRAVAALVEEVKGNRNNNVEDLVYKRFRDAGRRAVGIIETPA